MYKKLSFLVLLLGCTSAFSQPGPYVSVEAGSATASQFFGLDDNGFAGRLGLGYLLGNGHFSYGVEAGALMYPHLSGQRYYFFFGGSDTSTLSGYNVDLLAVVKYTFDNNFLILGKLGPSYIYQTEDSSNIYYTRNYHSFGGTAAIGIGYQATPQTAVTLTSSFLLGGGDTAAVSTLMLGLNYSFGS